MALNDYDSLILGAANQYNLDPQLLKSIMSVESGGDPKALGQVITEGPDAGKRAQGLMQFTPSTAPTYGVKDPFDPTQSIYGGAHYVSDLLGRYGSPDIALDHYSGYARGYGSKILEAYNTVTPVVAEPAATQETKVTAPAGPAPTTQSPDNTKNFTPPPGVPDYLAKSDVAGSRAQHAVSADNMTPPASGNEGSSGAAKPAQPQPDQHTAANLSPEEQALYGSKAAVEGGPQKPARAPAVAQGESAAQGLSPAEQALYGATAPAQAAPQPAPQPAPPPPAPTGPPPPPIYQTPSQPLMRPGGDTSGLSADTQAQIAQAQQPVPAPTGVPVPAITPENEAAFAGFSHGARQAVNPLLETGSAVGNYIARITGAPIATDRAANDAAAEQAFQQQYGQNPIATGAATGARIGLPFVMGGATGTALRTGLELAGLPQTAEFLSGAGGVGRPGVMGWLNRLASGATTGAVQGLVTGGAPGAVTGAALGSTVLPAVGAVANYFTGRTAQGAASNAIAAIYRAAQRDGMTPADLDAAIAQLGPQATLADVGGANLRQLAEGTANAPGPGQEIAWRFLQQRAEGQTERMTQAVRDATGATGSAFDNMEALRQARGLASAPAYANAFDNTVVTRPQAAELSRFIATPIGQRALQNGLTDIQLEQEVARGQPVDLSRDYGVTQNPDGSYELQPGAANLRLYDAVKRGYDSLVERFRDPTSLRLNLSGTTSVPGISGEVSGNTLSDIRQAYTSSLRRLFPQYGDALDAWAGPSADMDALSLGRRVLTTDADQTAANVARLSPSQMQMYQVGLAQALRDRIESVADSADATRRVFGNTQIRNRLAAGFGGADTPAFQNFQNIMEREALFADTNRQMLQGSPTARRFAGMMEAQNPPLTLQHVIEPALHIARGNLPGAAFSLGRTAVNSLLGRTPGPSIPYSQALGNALFSPSAAQQAQNMLTGTPTMTLRDWIMGPLGQQTAQFLANYPRRVYGPRAGAP